QPPQPLTPNAKESIVTKRVPFGELSRTAANKYSQRPAPRFRWPGVCRFGGEAVHSLESRFDTRGYRTSVVIVPVTQAAHSHSACSRFLFRLVVRRLSLGVVLHHLVDLPLAFPLLRSKLLLQLRVLPGKSFLCVPLPLLQFIHQIPAIE